MSDILLACDETAATELVHDAEAAAGSLTKSGAGSLGPFSAAWTVSAHFANGTVDLIPTNTVRITDCVLHYNISFNFTFDVSRLIPDFCLPQLCISLPFIGDVCTPRICVDWPSVTIPVNYSDQVKFTADFRLVPHLVGSEWLIDLAIVGIPFLQISPAAAAILTVLGTAAAAVLVAIPFIGPFLAGAVITLTALIGVAGVTGLLGPILSLFVAGRTFTIYKQSQRFNLIPAVSALEPAVDIDIDNITAKVQASNEDELLIGIDVS